MLAKNRSHCVSTSVRIGSRHSISWGASTSRYWHQNLSHHSAICLCEYGDDSGLAPQERTCNTDSDENGKGIGGLCVMKFFALGSNVLAQRAAQPSAGAKGYAGTNAKCYGGLRFLKVGEFGIDENYHFVGFGSGLDKVYRIGCS